MRALNVCAEIDCGGGNREREFPGNGSQAELQGSNLLRWSHSSTCYRHPGLYFCDVPAVWDIAGRAPAGDIEVAHHVADGHEGYCQDDHESECLHRNVLG